MIKLNLELSKIETMVSGGCKVVCRTSELPPEAMAELFALQAGGQFAAAFQGIEKDTGKVIKVEDVPSDSTKTPSQRLRSVLYLLWKEQGGNGAFENFYNLKMEGMIDHFKSKLP